MFKKILTRISVFLFFVAILLLVLGNSKSYSKEIDNNDKIPKEGLENVLGARKEKIVPLKLSFIGDSLLAAFKGEKYYMNFQDLLDTHDYTYPYKNVSQIFSEDDFTIANGENVFTDKNLLPTEKNYSPAYWYYSNSKFANIYKESSIEVVSVMNNHSYDYGHIGFIDTIDALNEAGAIVGAEEPVILSKNDVKVAIFCINLFHRFQYENTARDIEKIKDSVNYVIVFFHGGTEYKFVPDNDIVEYSHGFIDHGADLVIGCHPHVLQPKEVYKDKTIVYSLGSFLFGGAKSLLNRTVIYQINLTFNLDKNLIEEEDNFIPCYLYTGKDGYESWLPSVITDETQKKRVIDFMNNLVSTPN